jgi:sugar lactone lactonase YvrE
VLASGFGSPDDLAVDPRDGTIYFGDFGNSAVNRLPPEGGTPVPVATGIQEPEGIVVLDDGRLIVAEQKTNRILLVDPRDGSKRLLRQMENITGQDGIDGLGIDRVNGELLVPDSPNNRMLAMSLDGAALRVIARGFQRPTGAARLPGGDILVAAEFGNALYRVTQAGKSTRIATMYQPDDVVVDAQGMAYVNSLGGAIYKVDPNTGTRTTLLTGLKLPHGLDVDPQGRLVIAEAGRNRIFRLVP